MINKRRELTIEDFADIVGNGSAGCLCEFVKVYDIDPDDIIDDTLREKWFDFKYALLELEDLLDPYL